MAFKRGYLVWALIGNFVGLALLLAVVLLAGLKRPNPGQNPAKDITNVSPAAESEALPNTK